MHRAITVEFSAALERHLAFLYGSTEAAKQLPNLIRLIERHLSAAPEKPPSAGPLDQRDALLITYADQVQGSDELPLRSLARFFRHHLHGMVSGVHILPFYPFSSDDGFSVIDYRQVNEEFGSWEDIRAIAAEFRLMVDAVINHISVQSNWFQAFLRDDPRYREYFLTVDPSLDLSGVVRPRDLSLLTPFQTAAGSRHVWTTFSTDQVDLNFGNPQVLLEILDCLLFYVRQGVQIIRLDAIAFLWKEIGTTSIHLPQTHEVVKLMRTLLREVAPWIILITETNVPHEENLSYFGDGTNEAQLVYQFALPPLVLHTLCSGNAAKLTAWAADLKLPSDQVSFFNFTASHDGIGLRPVSEILSEQEIATLVRHAEARGGGVSYRSVAGAGRLPYELNITYLDAMTDPAEFDRAPKRAANRFLASQAIMLALQGLPGIYFHSLFGSRNDLAGRERTGRLRSINREKLQMSTLELELAQPGSLRNRIFDGYSRLLSSRRSHPAFSPAAGQQILDFGPHVFAVLRTEMDGGKRVLCLHEAAGREATVSAQLKPAEGAATDLIAQERVDLDSIPLSPYQARWIDLDGGAEP